jgi:hypothetical protein
VRPLPLTNEAMLGLPQRVVALVVIVQPGWTAVNVMLMGWAFRGWTERTIQGIPGYHNVSL